MKKNHTMRAASLLLVLTLITSCFVGGTFAKYTTELSGDDTARVAKFGVTLDADTDLFSMEYNAPGSISVKSHDDADVIAPGTTGTAAAFTISGDPEVDVKVTVSLSGDANETDDDLTMVTLPAGTYTDYTEMVEQSDGAYQYSDEYTLSTDYKPVLWTLSYTPVGGTKAAVSGCENVNLDAIEAYLSGTLSDQYEVDEDDSFKDINGKYELTWVWGFDADDTQIDDNDRADTTLGQIAAGVVDATGLADYVAIESFNLVLRVEQVD